MKKLIQDFQQDRSREKRRGILRQWLKDFSTQKPAEFCAGLKTLTDRKIFMDLYHAQKKDSGFLEYLGFSTQSAGIDLEIKRHSDRLMKRILTKKRKGRVFEEIVQEKLLPLIQEGEWLVVKTILVRLRSLDEKSPLNRAYSRFIREFSAAFNFYIQVVEEETAGAVVHVLEGFLNHHGPGILPFVRQFFEADGKLSLDILGPYGEAEANDPLENDYSSEVAEEEARDIQELLRQVLKYDEMTPGQAEFFLGNFWRLESGIIERIFFSLKFPGNRELYLKFLETLVSPYGESKIRQMAHVFNKKSGPFLREAGLFQGPSGLVSLLFFEKLSWTHKYKLIFRFKGLDKVVIKSVLKLIKERVYSLEKKEAVHFMKKLQAAEDRAEFATVCDDFKKDQSQKLIQLAGQLKQFIQRESSHWVEELKLLYQRLFLSVQEGKAVDIQWLLDLIPHFWEAKGPRYFLKIIYFFLHYHIILDLRLLALGLNEFARVFIMPDELPMERHGCSMFFTKAHQKIQNAGDQALEALERIMGDLKKEQALRRVLLSGREVQLADDSPLARYSWNQIEGELCFFASQESMAQEQPCFRVQANCFFTMKNRSKMHGPCRSEAAQLKIIYQEASLKRIQRFLSLLELRRSFFDIFKSLPTEEDLLLKNEVSLPPGYEESLKHLFYLSCDIIDEINHRKSSVCMKGKDQSGIEAEISYWQQKQRDVQAYFSMSYHRLSLSSYNSLSRQMHLFKGGDPEALLFQEIGRIEGPLEKTRLAVQFLQHPHNTDVVEKARQIIEAQGIDRYRFLSLFYKILDAREDPLEKIRLIDEFSFYLQQNLPQAFDELVYLLNVQRQRAVAERSRWKNKVSDLWEMLRGCQKNQERLRLLDQILEEHPSPLYARYIRQIQRSILGDSIENLLGTSRALAFDFQGPALDAIMTFRNSDLINKANHEMVRAHRQALDLQQKYYGTSHLASREEAFSRLVELKKRPAYLNQWLKSDEKREESIYLRRALEKSRLEPQAKDVVLSYYSRFPDPPKITGKIETLNQAMEYFGKARNYDELEICAKVEALYSRQGSQAALELIQQQVFHESARQRDVGRLSRLVSSLRENSGLAGEQVIASALDHHISSMENFILNKAAEEQQDLPRQAAEAFKARMEVSTESVKETARLKTTVPNLKTSKNHSVSSKNTNEKKSVRKPPLLRDRLDQIRRSHNQNYLKASSDYIQAFRPIITSYVSNLYTKKEDFYTLMDGERRYFNDASLKQAMIKMLAKDTRGKKHQKLMDSLNRDQDFFYLLVGELFEERQTPGGGRYYLPNFLE